MDHSPGSDNSLFPDRSEVCRRHRWVHSDPLGGPFGDMKAELVWGHEICQGLLFHLDRMNLHVAGGTLHSQGAVERVQEMEELER